MPDDSRIFLGLGSNMGDRYQNLKKGIDLLNNHPHIWVINQSHVYQSAPLYHKNQDDKEVKIQHPLSEDHIQRAFHIIAELLAEKFEIDVTPEADTGIGTVDFKFSSGISKVLVEVKLSTHRKIIHGFETQLSEYILSENPEYSYFLVVLLKSFPNEVMKKDMSRIKRLKAVQKKTGTLEKSILFVDAMPKVSASKK